MPVHLYRQLEKNMIEFVPKKDSRMSVDRIGNYEIITGGDSVIDVLLDQKKQAVSVHVDIQDSVYFMPPGTMWSYGLSVQNISLIDCLYGAPVTVGLVSVYSGSDTIKVPNESTSGFINSSFNRESVATYYLNKIPLNTPFIQIEQTYNFDARPGANQIYSGDARIIFYDANLLENIDLMVPGYIKLKNIPNYVMYRTSDNNIVTTSSNIVTKDISLIIEESGIYVRWAKNGVLGIVYDDETIMKNVRIYSPNTNIDIVILPGQTRTIQWPQLLEIPEFAVPLTAGAASGGNEFGNYIIESAGITLTATDKIGKWTRIPITFVYDQGVNLSITFVTSNDGFIPSTERLITFGETLKYKLPDFVNLKLADYATIDVRNADGYLCAEPKRVGCHVLEINYEFAGQESSFTLTIHCIPIEPPAVISKTIIPGESLNCAHKFIDGYPCEELYLHHGRLLYRGTPLSNDLPVSYCQDGMMKFEAECQFELVAGDGFIVDVDVRIVRSRALPVTPMILGIAYPSYSLTPGIVISNNSVNITVTEMAANYIATGSITGGTYSDSVVLFIESKSDILAFPGNQQALIPSSTFAHTGVTGVEIDVASTSVLSAVRMNYDGSITVDFISSPAINCKAGILLQDSTGAITGAITITIVALPPLFISLGPELILRQTILTVPFITSTIPPDLKIVDSDIILLQGSGFQNITITLQNSSTNLWGPTLSYTSTIMVKWSCNTMPALQYSDVRFLPALGTMMFTNDSNQVVTSQKPTKLWYKYESIVYMSPLIMVSDLHVKTYNIVVGEVVDIVPPAGWPYANDSFTEPGIFSIVNETNIIYYCVENPSQSLTCVAYSSKPEFLLHNPTNNAMTFDGVNYGYISNVFVTPASKTGKIIAGSTNISVRFVAKKLPLLTSSSYDGKINIINSIEIFGRLTNLKVRINGSLIPSEPDDVVAAKMAQSKSFSPCLENVDTEPIFLLSTSGFLNFKTYYNSTYDMTIIARNKNEIITYNTSIVIDAHKGQITVPLGLTWSSSMVSGSGFNYSRLTEIIEPYKTPSIVAIKDFNPSFLSVVAYSQSPQSNGIYSFDSRTYLAGYGKVGIDAFTIIRQLSVKNYSMDQCLVAVGIENIVSDRSATVGSAVELEGLLVSVIVLFPEIETIILSKTTSVSKNGATVTVAQPSSITVTLNSPNALAPIVIWATMKDCGRIFFLPEQ